MTSKRLQPEWKSTSSSFKEPVLRLYNGLTRRKEIFVPKNGGKDVTWYNCGPTVYDASHMGHARTYLSFDILRRVLSSYFGYSVFYVMNITDIDDKIIKRARQNHLFLKYCQNQDRNEISLISDINTALQHFASTLSTDPEIREMQQKTFEKAKAGLLKSDPIHRESLLKESKDVLSEWLDFSLGHTVTENSVFADFPRIWEEKFHSDMKALNVLPPDALTRISEYIPENIEFIKGILTRGFAYESHGSVYFDVLKFDSDPKHHYGKLVPEAFGANEPHENEKHSQIINKKSAADFALWKKSKVGEPSWDSPWGPGRPGWHLECSAMASSLFGSTIDIHSGGCDLKFPHHDNELAQSEAYHDHSDWIRYFLHSGHLTIAGCKMSKSLKNFITISEVLESYTARQLRLTFLLHSWTDTLDYSSSTMEEALSYEKTLNEFFLSVKHVVRTYSERMNKWSLEDKDLHDKLRDTKRLVHESLCDNVDTKKTCDLIKNWVSTANIYLEKNRSSGNLNAHLLVNGASYITEIFSMFGLIDKSLEFGFPSHLEKYSSSGSKNVEELLIPYLESLAVFRNSVRKTARELKAIEILKTCDELRDVILPELGVRLEDKENEPTVIKLVRKEDLLREKKQKNDLEVKKMEEKEKNRIEKEKAEASAESLRKIPPHEMFLDLKDKYSKFDESGLPTHDANGVELSQAQSKKCKKLMAAQEKKFLKR